MQQQRVGLADLTGKISADKLVAVAAAINTQVSRDLPQYWPVSGTVEYLPNPKAIPQGCWPVFLVAKLPPEEGGFHMTQHNQPYAKVIASPANDDWTIDVAHETIEMLVDPYGNKLQTATSIEIVNGKIKDGTGKFEYLVEACDPCEANGYGYLINGILVSDFLTPHFYDRVAAPDARYSFTGVLKFPRNILPGGYISWVDPQTHDMQQLLYLGAKPTIRNLGSANGQKSLRMFVDSHTNGLVGNATRSTSKAVKGDRAARAKRLATAAVARARLYP